MRKFISLALALMLVFSLATVAMAVDGENPDEVIPGDENNTVTNQDASFTKTYKIINENTTNPGETFTFTFAADHLTDSNANLGTSDMPSIPAATVEFTEGQATIAGLEKAVNVALSNITWPGVGVYYYTVNETAGTTAGVTYDTATAYLKVTVAYDSGTHTYYTAFVTLSLADTDNNGQTDTKTGGFTNEYSAGSLAVKKEVTGNLGDTTKEFEVTVTFTKPTGKTISSTIRYTDGTAKTIAPADWKDGTAEVVIYLKHDETVTFTNIPYGVTYTVEEGDYTAEADGGYDAATYVFSDETNKKIDTASDTVTITNNKSVGVDTGITLDSLPFVLILAVCAGAVVLFVVKRRRSVDF